MANPLGMSLVTSPSKERQLAEVLAEGKGIMDWIVREVSYKL